MARNPHAPSDGTRLQVKTLAMVGTPQDQIAAVIGIDRKTLTKHYRKELDTAMILANAKVGQSLFQQANNGNTSAAIFWLKCRAGWHDTQKIEHTGANGDPLNPEQVTHVVATHEQIRQAMDELESKY